LVKRKIATNGLNGFSYRETGEASCLTMEQDAPSITPVGSANWSAGHWSKIGVHYLGQGAVASYCTPTC